MSEMYKRAGVDVHAGYEAVSLMRQHINKTKTPGVIGDIGGFGGLFDMSGLNLKEPVLVSGTDGVGTKLLLAFEMGKHDTVGIDAVAMCANDIIVVGAKPLFFLDYIACGKLKPKQIEEIVAGVSEGCLRAGAALIGGETAEMPGMYKENEYDIAGFCVGVVEKREMISGQDIMPGDVLIALPSSGVHSNGFSLIRKIISDNGLRLTETYDCFDAPLGEVLLTPTRIYVKTILEMLKAFRPKGIVHITGGGFYENIPRILPQGHGAVIQSGAWKVPRIFTFLQEKGKLKDAEMYNVFNMGVGMVIVADEKQAQSMLEYFEAKQEKAAIIGRVELGDGVVLV